MFLFKRSQKALLISSILSSFLQCSTTIVLTMKKFGSIIGRTEVAGFFLERNTKEIIIGHFTTYSRKKFLAFYHEFSSGVKFSCFSVR